MLEDSSLVITGGDDAVVRVWRLSRYHTTILLRERLTLCSLVGSSKPTARNTWSSHTLPITDVFAMGSAACARAFTTSRDCTCKVYFFDYSAHFFFNSLDLGREFRSTYEYDQLPMRGHVCGHRPPRNMDVLRGYRWYHISSGAAGNGKRPCGVLEERT